MKSLSLFVTNLIRHGELQLSKLLRRKSLERFHPLHIHTDQVPPEIVLIQNSIASKRATLLDFHSHEISEQLTLLDSELFLKIQLSEILYMSIEKGEEHSPNLAAFTEHFNNISYWWESFARERRRCGRYCLFLIGFDLEYWSRTLNGSERFISRNSSKSWR